MGASSGPSFGSLLQNQFGSGNPFNPDRRLQGMGSGIIGQGSNLVASGAGRAGNSATTLGSIGNTAMSNQWYGNSPIATAEAESQRTLGKNLAALRERYGAQGLGRSSNLGQAEGTAIGEATTGLGAKLAELGIGARTNDINSAINANTAAGNIGVGLANAGTGTINAGTGVTGAYNDQVRTSLEALLGANRENNASRANDIAAARLGLEAGQGLTGVGQGEQSIPNLNPILALLGAFAGGSTTGGGGSSSKSGPPGVGG